MPLPPAPRDIERLTEDWPGEPGDFELPAFASAFRSGRPELSAPALERIGQQVQRELGRRERAGARGRKAVLRLRRFAPFAAAAAVVLGVGAWMHYRTGATAEDLSRTKSDPASAHGVRVIQPRPAATGDAPPAADPASRPIVN